MPFATENNRHFVGSDEVTITGVAGPELSLLARIFIDLGIVAGTIIAGVLTGGTSLIAEGSTLAGTAIAAILPETVEGAVGLVTALGVNTGIDIEEGNTDAVTLGLDIGLPFGTELFSAGIGQVIKSVKYLDPESAIKLITKSIPETQATTFLRENIDITFKPSLVEGTKYSRNSLSKIVSSNSSAFGTSKEGILVTNALNEASRNITTTIRSLTDILDKVSNAVKQSIYRILPILRRLERYYKLISKQVLDIIGYVKNPVNKAIDAATKKIKPMIKRLDLGENKIKQNLMLIKQRANIRKQSILQNSLITQNNIHTVSSRWVLGYSVIANDVDEETGEITNGNMVIWFIPEITAHNGQRGATPEPLGKRPVIIPNLDQAGIDSIINEPDMGTYYYNNVAYDQSNSSLFDTGFSASSDSGADFLAGLFKNSLSIIPGYSLYMGLSHSIGEIQDLGKRIVSGQLGTDYMKQLTNYHNTLNRLGSAFIPKGVKSAAHLVESGTHNDYAKLLQPAEKQLNGWNDSITKRGQVRTIKHI